MISIKQLINNVDISLNIQQGIQYLHNKKDKSVASIGGLQNLSYIGGSET